LGYSTVSGIGNREAYLVGWGGGKYFSAGGGKFRCRNLSGCSPIDAMLGTKVDRNAVAAKQASLAVDGIKA